MGTTLHEAVQSDDLRTVRRMILAGGDINAANSVGHTLLHLAKSVSMAEWLIEAGDGSITPQALPVTQ